MSDDFFDLGKVWFANVTAWIVNIADVDSLLGAAASGAALVYTVLKIRQYLKKKQN